MEIGGRRLGRVGTCGVLVVAVLAAGCGNAMGGDASSPAAPAATAGDSVPTVETALLNGGEATQFPMTSFDGMTRVATDSVPAPSDLPFNAAFPKSADVPMGVFVSIPADYPVGEDEVVAEYDASSPYGPFRVREEKTPKGLVDQSFIEGIPSICDSCTDARLVDVTSDIKGALLAGPSGPTSVTWLQGDYEMIVIGPEKSFSPDTSVALAREVATAFNP
jgi:hypothetical protein